MLLLDARTHAVLLCSMAAAAAVAGRLVEFLPRGNPLSRPGPCWFVGRRLQDLAQVDGEWAGPGMQWWRAETRQRRCSRRAAADTHAHRGKGKAAAAGDRERQLAEAVSCPPRGVAPADAARVCRSLDVVSSRRTIRGAGRRGGSRCWLPGMVGRAEAELDTKVARCVDY